ncbi:MAG: ABC transporter ATP-binding protein [bacterium]
MKDNTKKTLKYFWKAGLKYKVSGFFNLFSVVIAVALGAIAPLYYRDFFNVLANSGLAKAQAVLLLIKILIIIGVINLLEWIFWRVSDFAIAHFESHVIADLNSQCFEYLQKHSSSFFNNNFVGALVKRVKWFGKAFENIIDKLTWNIIPLAVSMVIISIVLFKRSFWIGLGVVVWTALFLFFNFIFAGYKLRYDIKRTQKETETTGILADTITNHGNINLFNGLFREAKFFKGKMEEWRKLAKFTWNLNNFFHAGQGFLMVAFEVGIMYGAIILWQRGFLTIGDFALLQSYLISIFHRVWDFNKVIRNIYESLADAEEMTEILETPHEIQDMPKAKKLLVSQGSLEFKNVDFYYNQTRPILKDFNLVVKSREKVALIGPSGSGKTTLAKLILRMHDVTAGEISIDGQNIAKVTQESLKANIAFVPQDPLLFHRTLLENIRYGRPLATEKEIITASKMAQCHEFITNLSDGYNTYVGERGVKLSGGERQRVAIARAILRNAQILILDEATSSLDSSSELLIQKAISELMKNKTVIVIAHRLSTIRQVDRILVIDNGKIKEEGTHQELTKFVHGEYKRLWNLQALGFK